VTDVTHVPVPPATGQPTAVRYAASSVSRAGWPQSPLPAAAGLAEPTAASTCRGGARAQSCGCSCGSARVVLTAASG